MPEILSVQNLRTEYFTGSGRVKAVDKCSLSLLKGETLGIAGESGCGKSTFAMSLLRLIQPPHKIVEGSILYKGADLLRLTEKEFQKIRWDEIALVLQQSMNALNPMLRISDQMIEPLLINKTATKTEAKTKAKALLELVGIEPTRIDNYPHEFSGGMKQRVLIALSLISNPKILILDEPTTALDVVVQHMILKMIYRLKTQMDLSVIWITHDLAVLAELCDRIVIMYAGRIMESGSSEEVILDPKHPYTKGLIASFPTIDQINKDLVSIPGSPPDLINPPQGCPFHPRCNYKTEICTKDRPVGEQVSNRKMGYIECHNWREIE
ncbi:MAG: ABC transporter ATP-binding protein [Candidatus Hodarchaeales archaeon]|jgi:peptide/nickel transport system ATP-binding protein